MILLALTCWLLVVQPSVVPNEAILQASALYEGGNRRVSVINESVWDIKSLQISPINANKWGGNLLSSHELLVAGGGALIISVELGVYDLKVTDTDGSTCVVRRVVIDAAQPKLLITDSLLGKCLSN